MNNDELKELISDAVGGDEEILNEIIVLEGDEFADGAIGLTDDYHVIYDYDRLVVSLMKHNSWTSEEAIEWIEYNTLRAIPYMSSEGNAPVICMTSFVGFTPELDVQDEKSE